MDCSTHASPPRPSPTPGACSNSCPSSRWCHPTISSFVVPFSSCAQSFPASGSFPMSQFFTSGGQRMELQLQSSIYLFPRDPQPTHTVPSRKPPLQGLLQAGAGSSITVFGGKRPRPQWELGLDCDAGSAEDLEGPQKDDSRKHWVSVPWILSPFTHVLMSPLVHLMLSALAFWGMP